MEDVLIRLPEELREDTGVSYEDIPLADNIPLIRNLIDWSADLMGVCTHYEKSSTVIIMPHDCNTVD